MTEKIEVQYIRDFGLCSQEHFVIVKGIAALVMLVAYYCMQVLGMSQLGPLLRAGSALFLFCAGYGVARSNTVKKGLRHYWENKVVKVWLPSIVALTIVSIVQGIGILGWMANHITGLYGWFLRMLMIFYAAFWVMAGIFKKKPKLQGWLMLVGALVAAFLVKKMTDAAMLFAFPVGVLFERYELRAQIRKLTVIPRILLLVVLAAVSVGGYFLANALPGPFNRAAWLICMTTTGLFVLLGVYFAKKVPVFGVFAFVGEIAFGLYLFHEEAFRIAGEFSASWAPLAAVGALILVAAAFSFVRDQLIFLHHRQKAKSSTKLKGVIFRS